MNQKKMRAAIIALIAIFIVCFFYFDFGRFFTLDYFKAQQQALQDYYAANPVLTLSIYMGSYIAVTALSLPGAAIMTLAAGALFGNMAGLFMVSFASSIGATLAFFVSRFLLRDYVQNKFGDKLRAMNTGVEKDGAFYLFTLRLVPVFPFFVINLAMGLTPIKTLAFYLVSQVGMLPGTFVYVNAGTQIGKLESLQGILSPELIFSFALLGVFPLVARKIISLVKARKIYQSFSPPKNYDYNLVVIGAGSAGLVSAYIAAMVKAKVALIEANKMGGDCLNTGCVPSKALIRSAKMLSYAKRARDFGLNRTTVDFDFDKVMERVQRVIKKVEPHDSVERYTRFGVDCIKGYAKITSPFTVEVDGRNFTTRNIIVATGARPFVPQIPGLDKIKYLTSDNIWEIRQLPKRLVVLGGGPIGSELTQAFARLGSEVTQVEMAPHLMGREDPEISEMVIEKFMSEGINVLTNHRAKEVRTENDQKVLICEHDGRDIAIEFDEILVAVGRVANTSGFGLEDIGVELSPRRTIETNELLQTNFPNIFCAGDVAGPYQFTHTAAHQAWYASVNALFGKIKTFKANYNAIPWATYTDPEVARVGLNELEAGEQNIPYEKTVYGIDDLDRAIADSEDHGFVKVLTKPGTDKIVGVTIVGAHAGDLISEYILAMRHGLGLNKLMSTIHIYPTLAEANKYAAGEWKKEHRPKKLLAWVERYHTWMRGKRRPSNQVSEAHSERGVMTSD
ncbi:pyridine nucleotide-disulfide oxidoreductase [Desulfosarcina alkanivorans]|uniref:Pyridine nucleotide-disulfide oxidoreductase n=1 Tax=Desulfosarcina alkanivorans TaxID=571177 RepID=A0A5K7Z4B9_9BACT|nr:FAD-dependent oxidoreductase [Desulfosarcina alkanivorans]BBO71457.1 pyridine nucleotide-disulfide oxidoreductase [Desulfosarcina alkanivorans]